MKPLSLAMLALALAGALSPLGAQNQSARYALRALEMAKGPDEVAHTVAIVGFEGQDQPRTWQILVAGENPNAPLREYMIQGENVSGPRLVERTPDIPNTPVLTTALRIDSADAFQISDDAAIVAGVGFDKLNYQLRWRGDDPEPSWMTTLIDVNGVEVGRVFVLAASGEVVHRDFKPVTASNANPPAPNANANRGSAAGDTEVSQRPPVALRPDFTNPRGSAKPR